MSVTVVAPCLYLRTGEVYSHPTAWSHSALHIAAVADRSAPSWAWASSRGFLLSDGRAVGRYDAARVAYAAGQIPWDPAVECRGLYSDDLWEWDGRPLWGDA